jgi:hypothetical protein
MHIHLDAVGGVSGNMFIGALLDAFPQWAEELSRQLSLAGFSDLVTLQTQNRNDGVLTGTFFNVFENENTAAHHHQHYHQHRPYRLIRESLESSELNTKVKQHALGIFHALAEAEAEVHGTSIDEVSFHEVGAWDSIADVICAAYLINCANQMSASCTWSVSSLPLGNGLVQTVHGALPVPAPAVTLLLKGFRFYRDEIDGERVTPTGAAILKYLLPEGNTVKIQQDSLINTGIGFGSRKFPGISNVLRVLVLDSQAASTWQEQRVLQINFEIDDQTAEDIATALEQLRIIDGVLDVCQHPVFGKKGRIATSVQVLAKADAERTVIEACFAQCSTIGLRKQFVQRSTLKREEIEVEQDDQTFKVKKVTRSDGKASYKVAMDDLALATKTQTERETLRSTIARRLKTDDD